MRLSVPHSGFASKTKRLALGLRPNSCSTLIPQTREHFQRFPKWCQRVRVGWLDASRNHARALQSRLRSELTRFSASLIIRAGIAYFPSSTNPLAASRAWRKNRQARWAASENTPKFDSFGVPLRFWARVMLKHSLMNQSPKSQPRSLILIVEDDPTAGKFVLHQLESEGFDVMLVTTVESACAILEEGGIAALLLDWHLGEGVQLDGKSTTGRKVLETARRVDSLMGIIVMSGFGVINVGDEAMQSGADYFMAKPIEMRPLISMITRWVKRHERASRLLNVHSEDGVISLLDLKTLYIREVVGLLDGNISKAAQKLGIHRQTISSLLGSSDALEEKQILNENPQGN
jgi:two-component system response regulator RegA